MSNAAIPCVRCRQPAAVTRGNASYCVPCRELMEWSDIITAVQNAVEPPPAVTGSKNSVPQPAADDVKVGAIQSGGDDGDPFARPPT